MSGGGNRREEDFEVPWPAFVDLLTSVLIVFTFFVLITTVAMSTMTMKTVEDIVEKKSENPNTDTESAPQDSEEMLKPPPAMQSASEMETDDLIRENMSLKEEIQEIKQQMAALSVPLNKSTEITLEEEKKVMTLVFKRNEISMLPQTSAAIKEFLKKGGKINSVTLLAVEPKSLGTTQAREQALARALNVRNVLIQEGISPKVISIRYLPTQAVFNSTDWVRLELN